MKIEAYYGELALVCMIISFSMMFVVLFGVAGQWFYSMPFILQVIVMSCMVICFPLFLILMCLTHTESNKQNIEATK